jgi:hypothetical protein
MGQDRDKLKKGGRDKGLVLSGTHTPHEYQSLVYARFAYTNDPSHRCSTPNPNRPVAFDEMMAADIGVCVPERTRPLS